MINSLDVHDLPEEEVKFIQKIIDLFRVREKMKAEKSEEKIDFASWPLGVKGKLTRQEIYDYL
ncbi:MAG: hypothetical protein ACMUIA_04155 [bacterium]